MHKMLCFFRFSLVPMSLHAWPPSSSCSSYLFHICLYSMPPMHTTLLFLNIMCLSRHRPPPLPFLSPPFSLCILQNRPISPLFHPSCSPSPFVSMPCKPTHFPSPPARWDSRSPLLPAATAFLKECFLCKHKFLPGKDICMYKRR